MRLQALLFAGSLGTVQENPEAAHDSAQVLFNQVRPQVESF